MHDTPPVFDSLDELVHHLDLAKSGSCSCLTKTPEVAFHDKRCLYRVLSEAKTVIEGIPAYAAQQRDEGREQYAREVQALWTDYKGLAERYEELIRTGLTRYSMWPIDAYDDNEGHTPDEEGNWVKFADLQAALDDCQGGKA